MESDSRPFVAEPITPGGYALGAVCAERQPDMQVTLTDSEMQYMGRVLQRVLGELRFEIASTDTAEFRERLQADERILRGIMERLGIDLAEAA